MKLLKEYPEYVLLGTVDGQDVLLKRPEWECDWYWAFGRVHTKDCMTHLSALGSSHMHDNLTQYLDTITLSDKALWTFCELVESIYTLRTAAELFYRGGSHIAMNPRKDMLKNLDLYHEINSNLIPKLIDDMYNLFG